MTTINICYNDYCNQIGGIPLKRKVDGVIFLFCIEHYRIYSQMAEWKEPDATEKALVAEKLSKIDTLTP